MYPTLSEFLKEFGIYIKLPIQSFGLILALSFFAAAWCLYQELKRRSDNGILKPISKQEEVNKPISQQDYIVSALIGGIVGYKFVYLFLNYTAFSDDPQAYMLSFDGNWFGGIAGASLFAYLKYREAQQLKGKKHETKTVLVYPQDLVPNFVTIAAIAGLLGAKVFHNLENLDEFISNPIDALLSFSGLTFYGGLIVAAYFIIRYAKKNGISALHIADANAPGLMLAYGIGRVGCQISGDGDWGIENFSPKPSWLSWAPDWFWAYKYPHNVNEVGVLIPGCEGKYCYELPNAVFPTPLYETLAALLIFGILWSIRKKIKTPGLLFSIYLIFNGMERFLIEKIRVNTLYHIGNFGITQAEIISTVLFLVGTLGVIYFSLQGKKAKYD
jgi:phosphatidylglycerol:prolipoprotein diacylglycerol transferase